MLEDRTSTLRLGDLVLWQSQALPVRSVFGEVLKISYPDVTILWEQGQIGMMTLDGSTTADARRLVVVVHSRQKYPSTGSGDGWMTLIDDPDDDRPFRDKNGRPRFD
jgi:hypothetical protein